MPKQKILIVDDDAAIVVAVQFLLEQHGFQTKVAWSGEEALAAIEKEPPDLILLDIMLPAKDGFEVCQRVRGNDDWKDIRILFVTALGYDATAAKGMALGADGFIAKPFANADLVAKIKGLLACPA
jgi:DNA-binding response OmpR family regulator